ncbi:hypothetical protein [Amycolatopsis sp. lyj-346]|uniref:hypothetical protein n=1 Tax=Amycolatopsis sp. lyj-346 TaxID=2789289 RepID=UPI00397C9E79
MTRDTQRLVDVLEATQWQLFLFVAQIRDNTATPDEHHKLADAIDELPDLLRSHGDDITAGIIPAPHDLERECA